jgi:hypothetical protein
LFTLANYANVFLLIGFVIFAIIQTRSKIVRDLSLRLHPAAAVMVHPLPVITSFCPNMSFCPQKASNAAQNIGGLEAPGFPSVEKLEEFDWKKTEPLKLRPFKPMYYLTMGKLFDGHRRLLLLRLTWC